MSANPCMVIQREMRTPMAPILTSSAARVTAGEQSFAVRAGDGVAVLMGGRLELAGADAESAEILLFDLS